MEQYAGDIRISGTNSATTNAANVTTYPHPLPSVSFAGGPPRGRIVNNPPFGLDVREWFRFRASLGLKMNAVRSKIERIAKNGTNQRENYRYAEAADIYDEVRKLLFEEKLGFSTNLMREWVEMRKTRNGEAPITKVEMLVTWTDLDSGYSEEMTIIGTGLDYGDKGIYKAYTGAEKYALVVTFMIPTGDDPVKGAADPEREFPEINPDYDYRREQPEQRTNDNKNRSGKNGKTDTSSKAAERRTEKQQPKNDTKEQQAEKEPHTGAEDADEPINEELKNAIKIQVAILAGFSDDVDKKKAAAGVYESLKPKLKCRVSDVKDYTMGQGREALKYLNAWIEQRKEKQRKKEEAIKQQIEAKEAIEKFDKAQAEKEAEEIDPDRGEESQVAENE